MKGTELQGDLQRQDSNSNHFLSVPSQYVSHMTEMIVCYDHCTHLTNNYIVIMKDDVMAKRVNARAVRQWTQTRQKLKLKRSNVDWEAWLTSL